MFKLTVEADRPGHSGLNKDCKASFMSPVEMPLRYSQGINSSMLLVFRK